jgi:hypothetical protein
MTPSYEAEIDRDGKVRLREPVHLSRPYRALVTLLEPLKNEEEGWLVFAESALAEDWNKPEEEAWAHLQPGKL